MCTCRLKHGRLKNYRDIVLILKIGICKNLEHQNFRRRDWFIQKIKPLQINMWELGPLKTLEVNVLILTLWLPART